MNLLTIAAGTPFLPTLAQLWQDRTQAAGRPLHDGLILLPTRRAARALAAAFLDRSGGQAILLPRIVALAGLDEAPLALAGALDLPPAISTPHRLAELARLILARDQASGVPRRSDAAWALAGDLATLMDEAERAEIDLAQGLSRAADPSYAAHWNLTLEFMAIVTQAWPLYLAETGLMNPAARQVALLDAQSAAWAAAPPGYPVLVVGNAGDIPAVGRLLRTVATMQAGTVVLPGLDTGLPDATWDELDEAHPQHGLRALLSQIGAGRGDVHPQGEPDARAALLRVALLPAAALAAWQTPFVPVLDGLERIHPADPQEEAVCIALILRDALETPNTQAALVTPDRALAQRVAAELARWGVVADDSAGEPLDQTPPAVFLRLLAEAVSQRLAPVPLLALLKHPLAGAGLATPELRRRARLLERECLRGPAPLAGLSGLRRAVDAAAARKSARTDAAEPAPEDADVARDLLDRLEQCLEPLLRGVSAARAPPADLLAALIRSAEALAAAGDLDGPSRLWAQEEGEALAELLAETQEALPTLPPDDPACLPALLDALLSGAVVRSRRATRGRTMAGVEHPRIFIWGLLEARLQAADLIVLGGLTEGVWPPATDPGPWMSRPMRLRAGLPSAEIRIGQAAHDFCMAAGAARRVVLSAPRRRDGAPAVPSRWLTRLEALLRSHGGLKVHPAGAWAAQLDLPAGGAVPAPPPRPSPAVSVRPRKLAVTDIATLLRDPYEIYARRVLRLRELDPLEQSADFRDYGNVVHRGLDSYLGETGMVWPADAAAGVAAKLREALRSAGVREALIAWWSPRLDRIAGWVDAEERRRRALHPLAALAPELVGQWALSRPGGAFVLSGRADRIERRGDGTVAILDYKTGTLPTQVAALEGREPQLLLEGAMVKAGAFGAAWAAPVAELTYWRLTGAHKPGEALSLLQGAADAMSIVIDDAADRLADLIDLYDDPATTYPAQPVSQQRFRSAYSQLARAADWGSAQDDGAAEADE